MPEPITAAAPDSIDTAIPAVEDTPFADLTPQAWERLVELAGLRHVENDDQPVSAFGNYLG